jgi:S-adenosylmethionine:diacylglycerol 3-amino-3-carboxypropyl transferase
MLLGGKQKILGLFECENIQEQKTYFDTQLRSGLLKNLFKLMFHRRLYKGQGVAEQGLIHMSEHNIGITFYNKFRDFCTSTPVPENWMLQLVLFGHVLYEGALPTYLLPEGRKRLSDESDRLNFIEQSYTQILQNSEAGTYNKFALSNVSDWLSDEDFAELMYLIGSKSGSGARGLIRYIHSPGYIPEDLQDVVQLNPEWGEQLLEQDRFPFYNLIPFQING